MSNVQPGLTAHEAQTVSPAWASALGETAAGAAGHRPRAMCRLPQWLGHRQ